VGRQIRLLAVPHEVGRSSQCDISLDDVGVSRRHAAILPGANGSFVLKDLRSANGTFVGQERLEARTLRDGDVIQFGPNVGFRYLIVDESQEQLMRHLYDASTLDALTGAFNRKHFNSRLISEHSYARRHRTALSLLILDVDHFKAVNDTYGHPAGDAALVMLTRNIQGRLRLEDVLARYGGEEFAVILRGEDISRAAAVAERLRKCVEDSTTIIGNSQLKVTVSIGCGSLAECEDPVVDALVSLSDRRLYEAKRGGRNRVVASGLDIAT
jgi:diguanylate cyclase (GGDEF)-like protein